MLIGNVAPQATIPTDHRRGNRILTTFLKTLAGVEPGEEGC